MTVGIILGYWCIEPKLPADAKPNRVVLILTSILMAMYILGDTCLMLRGYSQFLIEIKYIDDYIKIVLKLYVDFFGIWMTIYSWLTE